ncbi:MAG: hypothetical protein QXI19_05025 [Candidatus Caldarchaeum sp.]
MQNNDGTQTETHKTLSPLKEQEKKVIEQIARKVGTPVYVYFADRMETAVEELPKKINGEDEPKLKYCYAMLANSNPYLVQKIASLITSKSGPGKGGVLAASVIDLNLLRRIHPLPEALNLVYADSALSEEGIDACKALLEQGLVSHVYLILQNEQQCDRFADWYKKNHGGDSWGGKLSVGLRVKVAKGKPHAHTAYSGKYSRFGIPQEALKGKVEEIRGLRVPQIGFHIYPGTNLLDISAVKEIYNKFLETVCGVANETDKPVFLDLGGGFGIDYKDRKVVSMEQVICTLRQLICGDQQGGNQLKINEILLEPGRLIIGPSAVLVSRVVDVVGTDPKFVYMDTGYSHFARPYIYRELDERVWHHKVEFISDRNVKEKAFLVGATMASGDFLAGNPKKKARVHVPEGIKRGDLVCIMDVGAYGYCMSSNFSGLLRPPEVLVEKEEGYKWCVIRQRETFESFIGEVPSCLNWH